MLLLTIRRICCMAQLHGDMGIGVSLVVHQLQAPPAAGYCPVCIPFGHSVSRGQQVYLAETLAATIASQLGKQVTQRFLTTKT